MTKNVKKRFALLVLAAMLVSLFAALPAVAEEAAAAQWEPFAENVTLTVPVYDRGTEGVADLRDNYWIDWLQENFGDKYNITLKYEPIARGDVLTDYALLAAADSLPTILMEYDYSKLALWADDGYLTTFDMGEFAKVAPTYYNRMVELNQLGYSELNGQTFFALAERPYYDTNYRRITWYRQDWLEQIGYETYPTTWAERKEMYLKLKDAGLCEYPLGGSMISNQGADQNYNFRTFPLDEMDWVQYGDYAIPALGSDANYRYLKRENEKYHLGLINPEYYVIDGSTSTADFINGKAFEYEDWISSDIATLNAFYAQNPDAKLAVKMSDATVEEDGTVPYAFRCDNPFGMMVGFSSQATADEVKAAWMYMEYLTQPDVLFTFQWGIEDEHFTYDENGIPSAVNGYTGDKIMGVNNNKDYWCITVESKTAGNIETDIKMDSPQGLPQNFTDDIIANYYARKDLSNKGYAITDCLFSKALASVTEYQASLNEKYKVYRDDLVMCAPEEFDALYEKYAQQYLEDGFQEVIDERKQLFEEGYATHLQ